MSINRDPRLTTDGFAANRVLSTLSDPDKQLLLARMNGAVIPSGRVLWDQDSDQGHIYFPLRGAVSLVTELAGGESITVAMIGIDGAVGSLSAFGIQASFAKVVVDVELEALSIRMAELLEILPMASTLKSALARDADRLIKQLSQTAACNAVHSLQKRVARLLLYVADCLDNSVVPLTQERMAQMLGAQRTTVNLVLKTMTSIGVVRTNRRWIEIIDRSKLHERACECYANFRNTHRSSVVSPTVAHLPDPDAASPSDDQ